MSSDFELIKHSDIKLLNETLAKAKGYARKGSNEEKLTAILLFSNHVEYIATDILKNLRRMIKTSTYENFNGVISWPAKEDVKKTTLGGSIAILQEFNFPDKEDFIKSLSEFNKKRNKLIHHLLEAPSIESFELESMIKDFDNIFFRYSNIRKEISNKWPRV